MVGKHGGCLVGNHGRSHVESTVRPMLCARPTSNLKHVESLVGRLVESSVGTCHGFSMCYSEGVGKRGVRSLRWCWTIL